MPTSAEESVFLIEDSRPDEDVTVLRKYLGVHGAQRCRSTVIRWIFMVARMAQASVLATACFGWVCSASGPTGNRPCASSNRGLAPPPSGGSSAGAGPGIPDGDFANPHGRPLLIPPPAGSAPATYLWTGRRALAARPGFHGRGRSPLAALVEMARCLFAVQWTDQ